MRGARGWAVWLALLASACGTDKTQSPLVEEVPASSQADGPRPLAVRDDSPGRVEREASPVRTPIGSPEPGGEPADAGVPEPTPVVPPTLPEPPAHFAFPPLQQKVETYRLQISPSLLSEFYSDEDTPLQPAVFTGPDGKQQPVQMRLRGNSSRHWPKKSWRIEFPEGVKFGGRRKLNLISEWREQTMMFEKLAYDMLEAMGVPASRAVYVKLYINGDYQGVYLDLERVDKSFAESHGFPDPTPTIYRCGMKNGEMKMGFDVTYQDDWEKETNELEPHTDLESFLEAINFTPEPQLVSTLESRFQLEHHLRTMVVETLVTMGTVEDARSYLMLDDVLGKWSYLPWDFNNTDAKYTPGSNVGKTGDFDHPLFNFSLFDGWVLDEYQRRAQEDPGRWKPIFSNLNTRIANHPQLRGRLLDLYLQGAEELLSPAVFNARVKAVYDLLSPHMAGAPFVEQDLFADGPRYLQEYAANRTQFIRQQVAAFKAKKPSLVLWVVDPKAGEVEVKNLGTTAANLGGMVLTDNLRTGLGPKLSAKALAPGESVKLTLALPPEGEVGLFDGQSLVGVVDLLFYGQLPAGKRYQRSAADPLKWEVQ